MRPSALFLSCALAACRVPTTTEPLPIIETGNPERNLGVAAAEAETPPPTGAIDAAWVGLNGTKLILDEIYVGEHELEWETPEVVTDLAGSVVDLTFSSPNAGYNRVIVRPRRGRDGPAEAPAALDDASFVVDGTRSDGVAFRIISDNEDEIELAGGFDLVEEQKTLALGFEVERWLDGIDLGALTVDGDGTIHIDQDANAGALSTFDANVAGSVRLVDDLDEDGVADPTEPVLASP